MYNSQLTKRLSICNVISKAIDIASLETEKNPQPITLY